MGMGQKKSQRGVVIGGGTSEMFWLDTDPGVDDALALLLAIGSGRAPIAVSTVAGNQTLAKVTRNALRILALTNAKIPVYPGARDPIDRSLVTAGDIHGESGLDGAVLPEPEIMASETPAWQALESMLLKAPPGFSLVTIGPLTNLAMLLQRNPAALKRAGRIVVMGGSLGPGNITPAAEFNFFVDPMAADQILAAGLPITIVGLEVTHRVLVTREDILNLKKGGQVSQVAAGLLEFYGHFRGMVQSTPVHDPCAVAEMLWPGTVKTVPLGLGIDTSEGPERGRVVYRPDRPKIAYGTDIDANGVLARLFAALQVLDSQSHPKHG